MKFTAFIDKFSIVSTGVSHVLASIFLVGLFFLVNIEIFVRFVFNRSTLVADEYGGYLFVGICFFGFARTLKLGQFLRVSFVVENLSSGLKRYLHWLSCILASAIVGVMAWESYQLAKLSWKFGSQSIQPSSTPLIYPQAVLAIGVTTLCIAFFAEFVKASSVLFQPRDHKD